MRNRIALFQGRAILNEVSFAQEKTQATEVIFDSFLSDDDMEGHRF